MTPGRRTFIKQAGYSAIGLGLMPLLQQCHTKQESSPGADLMRVSPESQGVSSTGILDFLKAANDCSFEWHSYMLLRHGKVISEGWWAPFAPAYKHTLYSLSKSFTSTAVGFAIEEGHLKLEDKVISFFPDQLPEEVSDHLKEMDIRDLLTMNTGHETDSFGAILKAYDTSWISTFLAFPVEHAPGSKFTYDTGATYMLSAIVQKVTGEMLENYLKPRLFDPLGINDYDWEKSPDGINTGGFGLRLTTESIARFGQLYLQNGEWQGKQVVPADWVKEATSKQVDSNPGDSQWSQGYGYKFWRCKPSGAYRGDGAYGQYCIVMPEQDAVLAVTSESWDMGLSMDIMFDHLLPAFSDKPLDKNKADAEKLITTNANLRLPVPRLSTTSYMTTSLKDKVFQLEDNEFGIKSLAFDFENDQCSWTWKTENNSSRLTAGMEAWHLNEQEVPNFFPVFFRTTTPSKIAATATWAGDTALQVNLKWVEAIHGDQFQFFFDRDMVEIKMLNSVAAHDDNERNHERRPMLRGQL
ncbi:MAG: serine hydrolase [Saprospiraceae bacterium]